MTSFKISVILFMLPLFTAMANNTLIINQYPSNTPASDQLYLVGSITGWNPEDENYRFTKNATHYSLDLGTISGSLQLRVTRGSWLNVEAGSSGEDIGNRSIVVAENDTVFLNILTWKDLKAASNGKTSTVSANVFVIDPALNIPQLNRNRRIWVYLPTTYFTSPTEYFPVLYMHDGQNLFDASTSFIGEWGIDESMNNMINAGSKGAIVVGIDNGGSYRIGELTPYVNSTYGGGDGGKYINFIVETLMPYINSNFRTLTDRENTGIMGSSLGGLISCYGAVKFQDKFSKIGIFSPAFWINDEIFPFVDSIGYQSNLRAYFMSGANESETMVPKMNQMHDLFVTKGFDPGQLKVVVKADGQHSEWFWKREFPAAYTWLFEDFQTGIKEKPLVTAHVYPNPAFDQLTINFTGNATDIPVKVYNSLGAMVHSQIINSGQKLNINNLNRGVYTVQFPNNPIKAIRILKE